MASLKQQVEKRVNQKDYQGAIELLQQHNPPGATEAIAKLRAKLAQARPAKHGTDRVVVAVIVGILLVAVIVLFGIPALTSYLNRVQIRLEEVCRERYTDGWLEDEYTFSQLMEGCQYAAQDELKYNRDEVNYCFNEFGQTTKRFAECLDGQAIYISDSRIKQVRDNPDTMLTPPGLPTLAALATITPG